MLTTLAGVVPPPVYKNNSQASPKHLILPHSFCLQDGIFL